MSVDLTKYTELKDKEAVEILKTENSSAFSYSKYDESTGEKLSNEVIGFEVQELEDRKKELQDQITEIDAFLTEYNAIVVK